MKIEFILNCMTFSINRKHARDQRFFTTDFQDWSSKVDYLLQDIKSLQEIAEDFKVHGGTFSVQFHYTYLGSLYYTKDKRISSKVHDLSNTEKVLLDKIFDFIDINDKYVTRLLSTKRAGVNNSINVIMELII